MRTPSLSSLLLVGLCALLAPAAGKKATGDYLLVAPYTPFTAAGALNLSAVPHQAALVAAQGFSLVWVCGGMSQFYTMTLAERMALAEAWVTALRPYDLYTVVHVSHTAIEEANQLALHAQSIGADAVGVMPPYLSPSRDIGVITQFISKVLAGVQLPAFYYHLPAFTNVDISILPLLQAAKAAVPTLRGVKYVGTDVWDFKQCLEFNNGSYAPGLMWAPNPKLQAFPFGARGVVSAESYLGQYYTRMSAAYLRGDVAAAVAQEDYIALVRSKIPSGKYVLRGFGIDLGPPRLPDQPISEARYQQMYADLATVGFWGNRSAPAAAGH